MNCNTQVKENLNAHMGRWVNMTKALEFISYCVLNLQVGLLVVRNSSAGNGYKVSKGQGMRPSPRPASRNGCSFPRGKDSPIWIHLKIPLGVLFSKGSD